MSRNAQSRDRFGVILLTGAVKTLIEKILFAVMVVLFVAEIVGGKNETCIVIFSRYRVWWLRLRSPSFLPDYITRAHKIVIQNDVEDCVLCHFDFREIIILDPCAVNYR